MFSQILAGEQEVFEGCHLCLCMLKDFNFKTDCVKFELIDKLVILSYTNMLKFGENLVKRVFQLL